MGYGKTYIIGSFNVHNLSQRNCDNERAQAIAQIIKQSGMDLVALQEVLDDAVLKKIISNLPYGRWETTKKIEPKLLKNAEIIAKDLRGEGYAFIWNKTRIKKVETIVNGAKRVYEPTIYYQYKIDKNAGQKELVRNPLYGRFTPNGLGGGNFEIRIICTHIRFNGIKEADDPGFLVLRQNELDVLSKALYPKIADRIYGNMMPSYTILLGDYNMNLESSAANTAYIKNSKFDLKDGPNNIKTIVTVQDQLTTLKRRQEETKSPINTGYLANNYDHFTYDSRRLDSINPRVQNVDVIGNIGCHSIYYLNPEKYLKEVSDHLPIIIKLSPNANSL